MSFHALAIVTCIAALLLATGWLFAVLVNALLAGPSLYEYRAQRAGPA